MKTIETDIAFSRNSRDEYTLSVSDENSRARFVRLVMTAEQFAQAITGLTVQGVVCEVDGLDVVGKTKITESRTIECPLSTYDKKLITAWLIEHGKEEGWIVNPYLGSQGSVRSKQGGEGCTLSYTVYRYE